MFRHGLGTQARFNFTYSLTIFLMNNYVYKKTAYVQGGVKAQDAGEELERIQQFHGKVTPDIVVDEARPIDSPLHNVFEWDDEKAAENYRHSQARVLIRSIEVIKPEGNTEPVFIHVQTEKAYLPSQTVVQDFDLFDSAKRAAEKRLDEATYSLQQLKLMAKKKTKITKAIDLVQTAKEQL